MKDTKTIEQIEPAAFDSILQEYPNVVPQKLFELDDQRYNIIPTAVEKRTGDVSLSKEEVATLVDWKLSHGKWRPMLAGLVQRNTEAAVQDQTREAFKAFSSGSKSPDDAKLVINILSKLQGIGPATASLLLSVFDLDVVPFFSDELFRWCFVEDGNGKGWDRKIKYDVKEYVQLYARVQELRQRFKNSFDRDVPAVEIEKVAYVLGKTATGGMSSADNKKRKTETDNDATTEEVSAEDSGSKATEPKMKDDANRFNSKTKTKSQTKATSKIATVEAPSAAANRPKRQKK